MGTRKVRQGRQEAEVEVRRFSLAWTGSGTKGTEDVDVWGQTQMGGTCRGGAGRDSYKVFIIRKGLI